METSANPCHYSVTDGYSQALAIGTVFIILFASLLGTSLPILAKHFPAFALHPFVYICGKHVGTGVLLALSLIHLLAPAFAELGNDCLPNAWRQYQYAPLFALLAALVMHFIEIMAHELSASNEPTKGDTADTESGGHDHEGHTHFVLLNASADKVITAYILEFGLTAHSVIIGITVGVSSRTELDSLIPALCFHQFFEGFALGARLADVGFNTRNEAVLLVIYSVSAPLGIAIGVIMFDSYNTNSVTASLTQGCFDSVSAGILLYVAFSIMLAIEFTKDYRECRQSAAKKVALWTCVWIGAGVMALIGNWL